MTADFGKLGLLLTTMAFQLQIITLFYTPGFGGTNSSDGQTVLAFSIVALYGLLVAEILAAEVHFADIKCGKIIDIIAAVILVGSGICIIIAIGVFGSYVDTNSYPYQYTTFVTAATAAFLAAVFLLLSICQCGKN